ncbi:MAG: hypothetical protein ACOYMB_02010 [Patescibacteria group bacterium]
MNILINNKKAKFSSQDFPILISGAEKTGSSFFSICLLVNLLREDKKVLLFSAYPMAKEEFRKQIGKSHEKAIIIDSGEEDALLQTLKNASDLSERVVLIKNIDAYSTKIFEAVQNLPLVIYSGDLDRCEFNDKLLEKNCPTKIFFSPSEKYLDQEIGDLPRYCGQIISSKYKGIIKLEN